MTIMTTYLRRMCLLISVTSCFMGLFTPTCGIITVSLAEEEQAGSLVVDLREALLVGMDTFPHVKFQIIDLSLEVTRSSPRLSALNQSRDVTWFDVDETSGVVRQRDRVDREALCGDDLDCYILVKVVLLPQSTFRFEQLHIYIEDINDNSPLFNSPVVDVVVPETSEIGQEFNIDRGQAIDLDTGNNSLLTYTIVPNDYFTVRHYFDDNDNPHLRLVLAQKLDYEENRVYRMTMTAHDGGVTSRSSDVEVRVEVGDENDNSPIFDQQIYRVTVRESMLPGQDITRVRATDRDGGRLGNVHYVIKDASSSHKWPVVVNDVTGAVTLRDKLDHKKHDGLKVLIEAIDGDPDRPRKSKAILILNVEDVNDNSPIININYIVHNQGNQAYVSESKPIGTYLAQVTSSDADKGDNGDVVMSVVTVIPGTEAHGNVTELGYFVITDENFLATGIELNRELRSNYDVIISACDNGTPSKCTHRPISVVVLDENEFPPVFQHGDFQFSLREDKEVGSLIATAVAEDQDSMNTPALRLSDGDEVEPSLNGVITYGVMLAVHDDSDDVIPIKADPVSGKITLIRALDYETRRTWKFIITARDGGRPMALQTTCRLDIDVVNVNDNKPTFVNPSTDNSTVYASTVTSSNVFTTIKALDFGIDEETKLRYSFRVLQKDGRHIRKHNYNGLFDLDGITGKFSLRTEGFRKKEILGRYKTKIEVSDSGFPPLTSFMTLYIDVIDTPPPLPNHKPVHEAIPKKGGPSMLIIAAAAGGAGVLIIILIAAIFFIRMKKSSKMEEHNRSEETTPSLSEVTTSDGAQVLTVRTRGVAPHRRHRSDCDHIYNTSSTQHTSASSPLERSCRLCDAPTSPAGMQKFIGQQQHESYANKPQTSNYVSPWPPQQLTSLDLSPVCSEEKLPLDYPVATQPDDVMDMGEQCTDMCKLYGHSDSCWMPVADCTVMLNPPSSPNEPRSPWQQKFDKRRKDSGCSVDTTSSALSYYKLTRTDPRRHNDVFFGNDVLPDVVNKSRTVTNSDVSSMMSSTTSSGASSTRPSHHRRTSSSNQKSPSHNALKKSNSDSAYDVIAKHTHIPSSMSTQC